MVVLSIYFKSGNKNSAKSVCYCFPLEGCAITEKIPYEEALKMSGHQVSLKYQPQEQEVTRKKRARKKKVIYFCPPYSKDVKTNIGARFLKLIDKHFPKGSELSKIINRNSMKVGYSCLRNMKKHIDIHNRKLLSKHWNKDAQDKRSCNCRRPEDCPVEGKCLEESVVYEADVLSKHGTMSYYGMTARPFKTRYTEHKQSLPSQTSKMCPLDRKRRYEHKSELSAYRDSAVKALNSINKGSHVKLNSL